MERIDVAIIGAGVTGLASARAVATRGLSVCVLERHPRPGLETSTHNSGVIHAGIYYKPGSYKAKLCVEGARLMKAFCEANGVPYENCGKVIVATSAEELPRLQMLYERGTANGVAGLAPIEPERLREIEPHARALRALHSPHTAIVDYTAVTGAMAANLERRGVQLRTDTRVEAIKRVLTWT